MMKRIRRYLATALIVAMMVSSQGIGALAATIRGDENEISEWEAFANGEETHEKGWWLIDGEWTYWKDGEMVADKMMTINKVPYYFDEDGAMASDETFLRYDVVDDEDISYTMYALPEGRLVKSWWMHLSDEGQIMPDAKGGSWYYFDRNGARLENTTKGIDGKSFYFQEDGKMLSRDFAEVEWEDGYKNTYFYEYDGQQAKSKWLNIKDKWYCFKDNGTYNKASDSDANYEFKDNGELISDKTPCKEVAEITFEGESEQNIKVGTEIKLNFDVQLASDSNAQSDGLTKNHDFWIVEESEFEGLYGYKKEMKPNFDDNTVTITYAANVPGTIKFNVVIDGTESEQVSITSEWGVQADSQKSDALNNIMDNPGDDIKSAVISMKSLLGSIEDKSAIKKTWQDKKDVLKELDALYEKANHIQALPTIPTDDAQSLLQSGDIEIVGGVLNAEAGETVELQVDKGDGVDLGTAYEKQAAFDLTFHNAGTEVSELAIPVIITMPLPKGISADGLKLFHTHEGEPELLESEVTGGKVSFVTDSFSNFIFAGNALANPSSSGSSGGRSSSYTAPRIPETPGNWLQLETGKWQFVNNSGAPYISTWVYVKENWYWMEPSGTMAEGWNDINGKRYYLMPVSGSMATGWLSDGTCWYYFDEAGAMKTDWVLVNNKWYYFGSDGIMLADTVTPDGSFVDATGVKMQ